MGLDGRKDSSKERRDSKERRGGREGGIGRNGEVGRNEGIGKEVWAERKGREKGKEVRKLREK